MSLRGVDLNLLVVLDALVEESSVTRAASRLGLSQSAASHALARLRAWLDDPLLVRTPRGMVLTARARDLAVPVRRTLDELDRALAPPRPFDPSQSHISFTLSLEDAGQVGLLPLLAQRLKRLAPGVSLRTRPGAGGVPEDELADGSVDLALAVSPRPKSGFHTEVVFSTPYVSIVRVEHPGVGKRLGLRRFAALDHVVLGGPGSVDPEIDEALAGRGYQRRAVLMVPSLLPIPGLVARSDLVATVPAMLLGLDRAHLRLARHKPPIPIEATTGSIVWHERTHHDSEFVWLRRMVREACRELAAPGRAR